MDKGIRAEIGARRKNQKELERRERSECERLKIEAQKEETCYFAAKIIIKKYKLYQQRKLRKPQKKIKSDKSKGKKKS